jgi:hypothetical protein
MLSDDERHQTRCNLADGILAKPSVITRDLVSSRDVNLEPIGRRQPGANQRSVGQSAHPKWLMSTAREA